MKKFRKISGFTIIELIVVVTVIMLLSGLGVVSLTTFNTRQKITTTRDDLITNLKLARNYATSMQTPDGFSGNLAAVRVFLSDVGLTVVAISSNNSTTNFFSKVINQKETKIVRTQNTFDFMAYKGNVGGTNNIGITITSTEPVGSGVEINNMIEIKNSGLINEK